jgi:transposase
MRIAAIVILTDEQRAKLETYARGRRTPARVVLRARIVLLAAEGKQDLEIAHLLSVVPRTAARWRSRFLHEGIAGLERDAPRPGRTPSISQELVRTVIAKTTQERPSHATHWSTRSMAVEVGISEASVRRIWHSHGLKPHRIETFKLSNDPRFAEKLEGIVGLYLNPPEHALVLSLDEKSQIQALDRTQPCLPMKKGRAQTMTHDYKRHGTTTLFAALNTLDGSVMATCMERHRHQEWLKFLRLIDRQTPADKQLHLIVPAATRRGQRNLGRQPRAAHPPQRQPQPQTHATRDQLPYSRTMATEGRRPDQNHLSSGEKAPLEPQHNTALVRA